MSLRRADWIPIGLVAALLVFVGIAVLGTRSHSLPVQASGRSDTEGADRVSPVTPGPGARATPSEVLMEVRSSGGPAVTRDVAAIRRQIAETGGSTFIGAMLAQDDSALTRLQDHRAGPVHVYIESAPTLPGWTVDYPVYARRGFNAWISLAIPIHFAFQDTPAGADLTVHWVQRLPDPQIGVTRRLRDEHWWIVGGEITMALETPGGTRLTREMVEATAAHEVGHFLGLNHSPDTNDLMAPRQSQSVQPTIADAATLRLLYSLPPGPIR